MIQPEETPRKPLEKTSDDGLLNKMNEGLAELLIFGYAIYDVSDGRAKYISPEEFIEKMKDA